MTTVTWFLAIACAVLLCMVVGVLHLRMNKQQTEITFDHAKVGRGIKQSFVACKNWFRRKTPSDGTADEPNNDEMSDKIHSMRA